ncbi:MAG: hypothetical protein HGA49_04215 [Eubacteriaceae bacterium]|nr:hypothetical protein [Eubacteriaceae bacterium]
MYKDDFIIKMIKGIAEVLAKMMFNKNIKNYEVCHQMAEDAFKEYFGIDRDLVMLLPAKASAELIFGYKSIDNDAVSAIIQLLDDDASVYKEEERYNEAEIIYRKSTEFEELLENVREDD